MEYLRAHQLDIMLFMCGMCGILAVMTLITRTLPRKTKRILAAMEFSAMMLLFFDRFSYIFRGNESRLGYIMVRIGNGMVYFFLLFIPFLVTVYLIDMLINDGGLRKAPKQLVLCEYMFAAGVVLVAVSQFTGLYYTFDEHNIYQRGPWHVFCYVIPFLIVLLQEWTLIKYRGILSRRLVNSMIVCLALPTVSSVLQIFAYGLSLTNMTTALVMCVFYSYALIFLSEAAERAKAHELEYYKEARKKEAALFEQTTEALANAIDAKDRYTRGHSARVARYSRLIAKEAGLSDELCDQAYFAALLHDVGKIG
ncbi:MAG: HDOD domain-containing protein, partial [Oscillospiraceae bacterium]|nr:HDOD domain-containing protein [Oscillospiraceae bacterium]